MCAYYPSGPYMAYPSYYYPYQMPKSGVGQKVITNMTSSSNITKQLKDLPQYLDQLQHVLKTTQSFVPYIKQYGPLIKSLPELIQVFKSSESSKERPPNPKNSDSSTTNKTMEDLQFLTDKDDPSLTKVKDFKDPSLDKDDLPKATTRPSCLKIDVFEEIAHQTTPALYI